MAMVHGRGASSGVRGPARMLAGSRQGLLAACQYRAGTCGSNGPWIDLDI